MRNMIRGFGIGYGSSGAAAAALFATCSCALAALGVFWLGGAFGALGLTVLFHQMSEARARRAPVARYSLQ